MLSKVKAIFRKSRSSHFAEIKVGGFTCQEGLKCIYLHRVFYHKNEFDYRKTLKSDIIERTFSLIGWN